MKFKGFKNTNIYVVGKGIVKTSLRIDQNQITEIKDDLEDSNLIELDSSYIVVPGFIDKHIHGANGSDFMNPSEKDILTIGRAIVQEGTTSCLATTMTQSKENINKALQNIAAYINKKPTGIEILGIHLEGPFISPSHAGAQPKEFIIPCDKEAFEEFQSSAEGHIKQVTLAYEENGKELTKHLVDQGIVVSFGHTDCNYKLAYEAMQVGATSATHTFNAMRGLHHRDIGVLGLSLLQKEINCELICDLIHVSKPAVQLLFQNKGKEGVCLVTDSMEAKWMPDGLYKLGGQDVIVKNQEARLKDGTLAGSTLKMNQAILNYMKTTGISLTEAIDCATIIPAKCLHVDHYKGSIEIGKDADLVVIDKDLNVYMTICRGEVVYSNL